MRLDPGTRLGVYEIVSAIGAGGMGEVYRAKDTRLDRTVAIKILRTLGTASASVHERLNREAKAISALDHPNVCALYDVGHQAGLDFIVIQYLEGETLAAHLRKGAMAPAAALSHAAQIAAALAAAHRRNIVHRDLKPANIMLTKSGVKLLDFGLAKLAPYPPAGDLATHTSPLTAEGTVVGTLNYMSPEQLEGREIDTRSDLFSFGAVLFEMLSGHRAFDGDTTAAVISAIMTGEPRRLDHFDGFKESMPEAARRSLERLLRKCFAKHPDDRWQSATDLADEIEWLREEWQRGEPPPPTRSEGRRWMPLVAAGLAGIAVTAGAFSLWRPVDERSADMRIQFPIEPPPPATFANVYDGVAVSPDGGHIVMLLSGDTGRGPSLWLRWLDSLTPRLLPGTENAASPSWSPDGRSVAFFADGKLKRVDIAGGPPLSLCDAAASVVIPDGISWSPRDTILFGGSQGLRRVHTSGGAVEVVTSVDRSRGEIGHGFPQFLPDGERYLYFIASNDVNVQGVYAGSVSEPARRQQLIRTPARAAFAPPRGDHPAYLLWIRDRALVAQPFDPDSLQFRGDAVTVTNDINVHIYNSRPAFSVSDAGVLAYFAGGTFAKRPLVWMRRGGKQPETAAPEDVYWNLDLAPADDRIAVGRWEFDGQTGQPNLDVGIRDSAGGSLWRVTTLPGRDGSPVWSPDGAEIAYASAREDGVAQIYRRKAAAGDGSESRLTDGPHYKVPVDWSADGKYIVFEERNDLMALPLEGDRRAVPIAQTRFVEKAGAISPNGRWFAFVANYSGRPNVYVKPFKPGTADVDQPTPVSRDGATDVKWSRDGKELFVQDMSGSLKVAAVDAERPAFRVGRLRNLFEAQVRLAREARQFDVSADGQKFLMILGAASDDERSPMTVVSNWQSGLTR